MSRTGENRLGEVGDATRRVREPMRVRAGALLAAVPLVLAIAASLTLHGHVESDLRQRAERGAYSVGVPGVHLAVHGRDVVARVPAGVSDATRASLLTTLEHVDGVRDVTVTR